MLSDTKVRGAKPRARPYKLFDERGLFILVYPNGRRGWRFRYRFAGREKLISFGSYPDTTLKRAREKRDEARRLLADNIDPAQKRRAEKVANANTFEAIAREWLALAAKPPKESRVLSDVTISKARRRLEAHVFPYIGRWPIIEIAVRDVLSVLRRIEAQGSHETAHRVRSLCGRVIRYAIATGRAERDVTADLKGALAPIGTRNLAAITDPARVGELLRAIDTYQGHPSVQYAFRLAPLVFVRPGELRHAEWSEIDFDNAEWRISAERMKMREQHLVPLSRQSIELLRELYPLTGTGRFLFPSVRTDKRPISDNSLNAALRRLGYTKDEMTVHGFRSVASTLLNETGWDPDLIEKQLAHIDRNRVRAAYNRAERLAERRNMMQAWADYLDALRVDRKRKVTALKQGRQ